MPSTLATYLIKNAGFTAAGAQEPAGTLATKFFRKGPLLLRQGEVCHHAFFVESGLLRAFTPGNNGKEQIIQFTPARGPFVMNTREELAQAFQDYRQGKFGHLEE